MVRIKRTKNGVVSIKTQDNVIKVRWLPVGFIRPTHAS